MINDALFQADFFAELNFVEAFSYFITLDLNI